MADTIQTIRGFYDRAAVADFARDYLFRVMMIRTGTMFLGEEELVYVKTATLPGRNIENEAVKYMGMNFNIPTIATYPNSDSFTLTFYCDANSLLRERLMAESRAVFNDATSTGTYNTPGRDSYIELLQLDKQLEPIMQYTLFGASIRNVGEIAYEIAEGTGSVKTFDVTFAYHFFEEKRPGQFAINNISNAFPNINAFLT
jgi:hypothetical protein